MDITNSNPSCRHGLYLAARCPVALLLLALTGCDGSGTGGEEIDRTLTGSNVSLPGRLISMDDEESIEYSVSTGVRSKLPIETITDYLLEQNLKPDSTTANLITGNQANPPHYVQTVSDCFRVQEGTGLYEFESCVFVYDEKYQSRKKIKIKNRILSGPAMLSRSGKYIAMNEFRHRLGERWSDILLMTVDDSELIDSYTVPMETSQRRTSAGRSALGWGANDELYYAVPSDVGLIIYITKPGSLDVARKINFPENYRGWANVLTVSPDGSKLLVGYNTDNYRGGVLLVDLDTLDISVPAVLPEEVDIIPLYDNYTGGIGLPQWSPDGEWIMVAEGYTIAFGDSGLGVFPKLYAVPANASRTVLTTDAETAAIPLGFQLNDGNPDSLIHSWHSGYFNWVQ